MVGLVRIKAKITYYFISTYLINYRHFVDSLQFSKSENLTKLPNFINILQ